MSNAERLIGALGTVRDRCRPDKVASIRTRRT